MTRLPQFPDNRPLTDNERQLAAAVGQVRQQHDKKLVDTVADVSLRKWCVEQAIKACEGQRAPAFRIDSDGATLPTKIEFAVAALARDIFNFVSETATKDEAR